MPQDTPRLTVTSRNGIHIVKFADAKILDEVNISQLGEQLDDLVKESIVPKLILDFSNVTHMSSSALGMLITVHKRVREKHGELRLAGIQASIYEVFVITRLNEIFQIHSSVDQAVASLP